MLLSFTHELKKPQGFGVLPIFGKRGRSFDELLQRLEHLALRELCSHHCGPGAREYGANCVSVTHRGGRVGKNPPSGGREQQPRAAPLHPQWGVLVHLNDSSPPLRASPLAALSAKKATPLPPGVPPSHS